ncbi:hypothetical protein RQM59_00640 [Flavobacteriaceae bacterium S356]|uniref:Uncharacterized protein n=1 Tax=Asprobacillus argus TaxID=3076534 RepID=A0ABU3LBT1_9FLAO|nr:hypothetical protein [Flavobacteriaceae bacterium S356]
MAKEEEKKSKKKGREDTAKISHDHPREDIRLLYDFEYNAIRETALVLAKGITYYITIFLGILGYIFTQNVEDDVKCIALTTILCMSVAILGAALYITWGLVTGLRSLQDLLKSSNSKLFNDVGVVDFFKRGEKVIKRVIFFCVIVLVALVYAMIKILPSSFFQCFW